MTESSGLPPEQEAVRRLLADARHDGPPPPEVVARLDDTLASLVAERSALPTVEPAEAHDDRSPGRVVDLGSRRRRVASIGLLAAASVVVAGVALGQVLPRGGGGSDDSSAGSASDSSLAEAPSSEDDGSNGARTDEGGESADSGSPLLEPDPKGEFLQPGLAGRPTLFSDDDEDIIPQLLELRPDVTDGPQRLRSLAALRSCDGVDPGPSSAVVSAQVDGGSGLVVFRRPVGEFQGVELYVCGDPDPVRTLTLPAP